MISVAILAVAGMAVISAWAYFIVAPGHKRLPMQWSLSGKVNWTAPRLVALSLTPALVGLVMLFVVLLEADPAERDMALLTLSVIGPIVHLLHIVLIARQTRLRP
ncbi:hypothetical protein M8R20_03595 [Pseudomonas sp. R2.Fl]|nr:hypothetical protein [Pseudomonas sp. R2.Fl]